MKKNLLCATLLTLYSPVHAIDLTIQLKDLKNELNKLLHSFRPILPIQYQQQQPQRREKQEQLPPSIVRSTTPLWDTLKVNYSKMLEVKIQNIGNEDVKLKLVEIFREWHSAIARFRYFEHALWKFIDFVQSPKARGEIQEPKEFVSLVKEFNTLFGFNVIADLKKSIQELTNYVNENKDQLNEYDTIVTQLFFSQLSFLLDKLAEQIIRIYNNDIIPAYNKNWTRWEGSEILFARKQAQPGPRKSTEWFKQLISHQVSENGLKYSQHKGQLNPNGLNSGFIDRAINALR
jgi:hypothetical protein